MFRRHRDARYAKDNQDNMANFTANLDGPVDLSEFTVDESPQLTKQLLEQMKVPELKDLANKAGIDNFSNLKKAELIEAILNG